MDKRIPLLLTTLILISNFKTHGAFRHLTIRETSTISNKMSFFQEIYIVKPGDTKFGLAKKFGISITRLEELNPHIIEELKVGSQIQFSSKTKFILPENQVTPTTSKQTQNTLSDFDDYIIQPKETLYGLSKMAKMSEPDFLKLNPILEQGVIIGVTIKMPSNVNSKNIEKPLETKATATISKNNLALTALKDIQKTICFVLPFDVTELKKQSTSQQTDKKTKEQVEFLKGALMAVESAKNLGLKINTKFFKSEELEKQDIQNKIKLEASGIILNSGKQTDISVLKKISNNTIPIINTDVNYEYSEAENIFNGLPSMRFENKKILDHLKKQNGQIIVIQEQENNYFKTLITSVFPNAKFITATDNGMINTSDLKKSLSATENNFVIMNNNSIAILLNSTNTLMGEIPAKKIHLVFPENSKMPNEELISYNRLKVLKTIYPSSQPDNTVLKKFIDEFEKQNKQTPSIALIKGFDVTYDTLLRLFQPKSFKELVGTDTEQLITSFDYKKTNSGSYSNYGIFIMQLDENGVSKIAD